jgi:hypothetical protein
VKSGENVVVLHRVRVEDNARATVVRNEAKRRRHEEDASLWGSTQARRRLHPERIRAQSVSVRSRARRCASWHILLSS